MKCPIVDYDQDNRIMVNVILNIYLLPYFSQTTNLKCTVEPSDIISVYLSIAAECKGTRKLPPYDDIRSVQPDVPNSARSRPVTAASDHSSTTEQPSAEKRRNHPVAANCKFSSSSDKECYALGEILRSEVEIIGMQH